MLKKIGLFGVSLMCLMIMCMPKVSIAENLESNNLQGIVDEFKGFAWKASIGGDVVYLINEGQLYGGIGFDIAQSPHEWAKIRAGYLPSPKRFGYVGIQLNGGKAIAKLLANMTSVEVQEFMEKALLNIGIQYAVNPNDWEQDYGLLLTILRWDF